MNEAVRRQVLARRKALSAAECADLSARICARVLRLAPSPFKPGMRIGLYRAIPGELDVLGLEAALRARGTTLCFPRIKDREAKTIEFVEVSAEQEDRAPDLTWKIGPYGIHEPHPELKAVDPASLQLIFVPGAAFGLQGERIGLGKGYYDRFLPEAAQAFRMSLAFDFQLLDKLDQSPWDQPVQLVLTESRLAGLKAAEYANEPV